MPRGAVPLAVRECLQWRQLALLPSKRTGYSPFVQGAWYWIALFSESTEVSSGTKSSGYWRVSRISDLLKARYTVMPLRLLAL